jgi:hypothetical protein
MPTGYTASLVYPVGITGYTEACTPVYKPYGTPGCAHHLCTRLVKWDGDGFNGDGFNGEECTRLVERGACWPV